MPSRRCRAEIIIPVNLEGSQACRVASFFSCPINEFLFTYLGLLLSPKALRKIDYPPLIEKLDKRLAGWKGRMLSRACRLVLLNSVLTSIPSLYYSAFRIPVWVTKAVDRIRRGFFWKGKVPISGFHCLVNWDHVCRPIGQGGLGIRSLRATNSALLMKSFWKFYCATSLPWVRIIRHKHYRRRSPCAVGGHPPKCSPFWKGVLSTSGPFHTSVGFTLGDGASVSFWNARWNGDVLFPALFVATSQKHLSVSSWLNRFATNRVHGFDNLLGNNGQCEVALLNNVVSSISLATSADAIYWRWNSKGCFSTRCEYNFLVFDVVDDSRIPHLWNLKIPRRTKIFLWLAARNRVLTADLLVKRGWPGPTICLLCSRDEECLEHLLFGCPFARSV